MLMKKTSFVILMLSLICLLGNHLQAQKVAFIDESYVLSKMPEYQTIMGELEAYSKTMQGEIESKIEEYKSKLDAFNKAQSDNSPRSVLESKAQELGELEQQIRELERNTQIEYQQQLAQKAQPISEKLQKSVDAVSADLGNIFIFRKEAFWYNNEVNNVSGLVLKNMNINDPEAPTANVKANSKFAYFKVGEALPKLPEYKRAQGELETFGKKLEEMIKGLQLDLQKKAQEIQQMGENAPQAAKTAKIKEFQDLQARIQKQQQEAQQQLTQKESALVKPIYESLEQKIIAVAKEKNIDYVLRLEASFYEPEAEDITNDVLAKFGVSPSSNGE